DDANKHLDKFLHVTQSIKVNGVTDDALRLYLFPHSLTHHATSWFDRLLRNSITTFEQMAKMFLEKYFSPSMVTKLRNEITNFRQRPNESLFEAWEIYKVLIDHCPNHNMLPVTQIDTFYNGLTLRHRDTINVAAGGTFMKRRPKDCYDLIKNMTAHHNDWDTSAQRSESSSSITYSFDPKIVALKAEMAKINRNLMKVLQINQQVKAITPSCETCGGPHSYNDCPATVGQNQNVYAAGAYNQGGNSYQPQGNRNLLSYHSDNYLRPLGFNQNQNQSNPNQNYQNRNQGNNQENPQGITKEETNSSKELEWMTAYLADLGAGINLMPLSIWNKLSLPELSPTCMTLKLTNRSISRPIGVTEDVSVKVGKFHFPANFLVVDFDADTRVTLILGRSFLKIGRALIDVYEGELTLHVGNKAVTFNLDQTSRYSANYDAESINQIDAIDVACEEYSQEVLRFSGDDKLPVIIAKDLKDKEKTALIKVLKSHKQALTWKLSDIKGINLEFCTHKILMEDDFKPAVQHQRRVNPKIHELNDATRKDHFPLLFMNQMLERLARNEYYCFLDVFSGYFQIPIDPQDQEKTTFTFPYGTFAYRRMPFSLCNAPSTFQRCMMAIFYDMMKKMMEVFMDKFSIFGNSFRTCLSHLDKMLKWCDDTNLYLNWEKSHFMVIEGIVLGHKISKTGLREKPRNVMKCLKMPSKFVRFSTYGALISWGHSRLHEGTSIYSFGTPRAIISDRGTHFCNDQFAKVMLKYGVTHRLATAYHPQTSRQVEVSSHGLERILERTVGENHASCDHRKVQLNELNELRDQAYDNSLIYKEKTKRIHDLKIKDRIFKVGDRVLLFNSRLKIFLGKLKTRWPGPFIVTQVLPYGTVELSQTERPNFKVNGHRLKHYFRGDIPPMVVSDL
nr:DNA-directed DNA polymerase [Tanacetum cinerariifolium]